jgi:hypothetical protein
MSHDNPNNWDEGLSDLIKAERRNVSIPDEAEGRVWSRVALGIAAAGGGRGDEGGGAGRSGEHEPSPAPTGGATRLASQARSALRAGSTATTLGVYALGVLTGIIGSVAVMRAAVTRVTPLPDVAVNRPVPRVVPDVVPSPAAMPGASSAPGTPAVDAPPTSRRAPGVVASPKGAASAGHALDDERVLLDDARVALGRADATAALHATAVHAQRYPQGLLAEEREAIAIQALLLVPRYDEARQREAAFERQHPHSMLLQAVRASVQSIP